MGVFVNLCGRGSAAEASATFEALHCPPDIPASARPLAAPCPLRCMPRTRPPSRTDASARLRAPVRPRALRSEHARGLEMLDPLRACPRPCTARSAPRFAGGSCG